MMAGYSIVTAQEDSTDNGAPAAVEQTDVSEQPAPTNEAELPQETETAANGTENTAPAETETSENTAPTEAETPENTAPAEGENTENTTVPTDTDNATVQHTEPVTSQVKEPSSHSYTTIIIVVLIIVIAYLLARYFAKRWRMLDHQTGYFIILFCFFGALISTVLGIVNKRIQLGIDLRGGSVLVYSVSPMEGDKTVSDKQMEDLLKAIKGRVDPSGVKEISIQALGGNKEVKVMIPGADEAELARIKRIINASGLMKFRILVSRLAPEEKELIDRALSDEFKNEWRIPLDQPIGKDGIIIGGSWIPVHPKHMDSVASNDVILRPTQIVINEFA
ncbi:MAG: hypothetical protein IKW74_04770, partial [Thermoguttaceae bacterium]|nr:hypothetical protein [Thermoguttaceae bacterium]